MNKLSMLKKVLVSHSAAQLVELLKKLASTAVVAVVTDKCLALLALSVVVRIRFLLSPKMADLSIVPIVFNSSGLQPKAQ